MQSRPGSAPRPFSRRRRRGRLPDPPRRRRPAHGNRAGDNDSGVAAGPHTCRVTAVDDAGNESPGSTAAVVVPATAPQGLTGTYFDTTTLTTQRAVRTDPTVNFGWGTGRPVSSVAPDTFSVRWTGRILPPADGSWTFYASSDDAIRVWVDGRLVVDDWTPHALREARGSIALSANRSYEIRIE